MRNNIPNALDIGGQARLNMLDDALESIKTYDETLRNRTSNTLTGIGLVGTSLAAFAALAPAYATTARSSSEAWEKKANETALYSIIGTVVGLGAGLGTIVNSWTNANHQINVFIGRDNDYQQGRLTCQGIEARLQNVNAKIATLGQEVIREQANIERLQEQRSNFSNRPGDIRNELDAIRKINDAIYASESNSQEKLHLINAYNKEKPILENKIKNLKGGEIDYAGPMLRSYNRLWRDDRREGAKKALREEREEVLRHLAGVGPKHTTNNAAQYIADLQNETHQATQPDLDAARQVVGQALERMRPNPAIRPADAQNTADMPAKRKSEPDFRLQIEMETPRPRSV